MFKVKDLIRVRPNNTGRIGSQAQRRAIVEWAKDQKGIKPHRKAKQA